MNVLLNVLYVVEIIVALLLIAIVLIQPSRSGGGLGAMGGGVTEAVLGASAGNILTKGTVIIASVFLGLTLILVIITAHRKEARSVVEDYAPAVEAGRSAPAAQPGAAEGEAVSGTPAAAEPAAEDAPIPEPVLPEAPAPAAP
jgi:preprotein translocase subunit SecG